MSFGERFFFCTDFLRMITELEHDNRSAAAHATWADPCVRAKRLAGIQRNGVAAAENRKVERPCQWPGCSHVELKLRSQARPKDSILCREHRTLVQAVTGWSRMNGLGRILRDIDKVYAGRNVTKSLHAFVFIEHGCKCGACKMPLAWIGRTKDWQTDHVVPVYKGGLTTRKNLMPLCRKCHVAKTRPECQEIRRLLPNTLRRLWQTHTEKDAEIAALKQRIAELEAVNAAR